MVDGMENLQDDLKRAQKTIDRAEARFWTACDALPERAERLGCQTEVAHLEELIRPLEVSRCGR